MDRSSGARVVLGRPSHPCRRVLSLRESDRRRAARRHDASRAGRSAQRRCGAELGPQLLSPAAVLRERRTTRSQRARRCSGTTSRCRDSRRATAAISSCCGCASRTIPTPGRSRTGPPGILPILKWAKAQGAVVGFAHSGNRAAGSDVANCRITRCRRSTASARTSTSWMSRMTPWTSSPPPTRPSCIELNIWYHTLNCGFRTRISGETDFPCITDAPRRRGPFLRSSAADADLRRVVRRCARRAVRTCPTASAI